MHSGFARCWVLPIAVAIALFLPRGTAIADPAEEFQRLDRQCWDLMRAGKYRDGERSALELRRLAEGPLADQPARMADALSTLGSVYREQARYAEAEPLLKRALTIREKSFRPDHRDVAISLHDLAILYSDQGRYAEAESFYRRALPIKEKSLGAEHLDVADLLSNLAALCSGQRRYAEAEPLCKRALAIRKKSLGPEHPDVAASLNNLAVLYSDQGRYAEAEPLCKRALAIMEKSLGPEHPDVAFQLRNLARLCTDQGRYAEAEPLCKRALTIREKSFRPDHPRVAGSLHDLGVLYSVQRRYAEAEPLCKRALAIMEKSLGPEHPDVAFLLRNLAVLYSEQGRYAEAATLLDRAIAIQDRVGVAAEYRWQSYSTRARVRFLDGRKAQAMADLHHAMGLAEQLRAGASGAEWEQAAVFAQYRLTFEAMVAWQNLLLDEVEVNAAIEHRRPGDSLPFGRAGGDKAEALAAMERSRARGLLDQMGLHGTDLLAGLPAQEAATLRKEDAHARGQVRSLQKQLDALGARRDLSDAERSRQTKDLEKRLRQAQGAASEAYAAIRAASPAYRLAIGQDRKPVALEELAKRVTDQKSLLLEYLIGENGSYALVVASGQRPRLEELTLSMEQRRVLGVKPRWRTIEQGLLLFDKPEPLTAEQFRCALRNTTKTGVLQLLRASDNADKLKQAVPKLGTLWEVLVPKAERAALLEKKYQRLVVIPDAALAQLPFETLVVEPGDEPRYLLDLHLPIEYAPSATILVNLARRQAEGQSNAAEPVLTLGDCRYPKPTGPASDVLAQLSARSRYGSTGGKLAPLVASGWEVAWVGSNFKENGVEVAQLTGDAATEAAVRRSAPGRRVLHFACHGLVDQKYGNLFGALALTPGPNPNDPADDGFLTLKEIYELDLKGCELAILSACETNVGPEQRGEGVWSLSRGFLVAGTRRVVASNWLVNDEAAASLVSIFCSYLAMAEKEGKNPDYAEALHEAKLWVRKNKDHPEWHNPYYWGSFVLIGPQ